MSSSFGPIGRLLDGLAAFAMLTASCVVIWTSLSQGSNSAAPRNTPPTARAKAAVESVDVVETVTLRGALEKGLTATATVALVEFSDFQCPYCGRHARDVYPALKDMSLKSGKIAYVFRHLPLQTIHPLALKAAEASECAGVQGKYWEMHDRLFENQRTLAESDLDGHAAAIGLSESRFRACMQGEMTQVVLDDVALAKRLGVSSTPTFFVGRIQPDSTVRLVRRVNGAVPVETFRGVLNEVSAQRFEN